MRFQLTPEKDTKARQINVETSNRMVQLNGLVDSRASRVEAEKIDMASKGVTKVENNMEVLTEYRAFGEMVGDAATTMKVDAALAADKRSSALGVDVETNSGEVQFSGFAKNAAEKSAAADVGKGVNGVRTVRNKIDVR